MNLQIKLGSAILAVAFVSGCAPLLAPPYSADYAALDSLKKKNVDPVAVGTFKPTDPKDKINNLTLRVASLQSGSGSFAKYLEDALISDLKEISAYDANAKTRIDAIILKNDVNIGGFSTGEGLMDVELTISRNGVQRLKKIYTARTSFESSFAGAVAIPKGQSEYPILVKTLLKNIYNDPAFMQAVGK